MLQTLLAQQKANGFKAFSGGQLQIRLPVSKEMLNLAFNSVDQPAIDKFEIQSIQADHFLLDFKPAHYRQMHLKGSIQPQIGHNAQGHPQLKMTILDGINFLEKGAILLFSNRLPDGIDMTPSKLTINLHQLFTQMELAYLLPFLHWKTIDMQNNQIIFNFDLKI